MILSKCLSCTLLLFLSLPVLAQVAADASPETSTVLDIPATDEGLPGAGPIRRYDWFRNLWRQKRNQWAQDKDKDQNSVVFLGDSITQGWGPSMGGQFNTKVANRGISGDTTRGVLIRLQEDVLDLKPRGVVLLIGTNDLEEGAKPSVIADNVRLILAELHSHNPKMPIVVCRVFPSSAAKKRSAADIQRVNQLCAEVVRTNEQVTMLDTYTLFANEHGDAKSA